MRLRIAKILLPVSIVLMAAATLLLLRRAEPFTTYFYCFAWWPCILILDSYLYLRDEELSIFLRNPADFVTFLLPVSCIVWFLFEDLNLRLGNWVYVGLPANMAVRWAGFFLAFATVLPGIFLTANLLEWFGVARKNEFTPFFTEPLSKKFLAICVSAGFLMLALPLLRPKIFYPLVWGGFIFLLDPLNASLGGRSLLQEWRQKNWNRTIQLLLAGLLCGIFWEMWNFWAGAKWIYTVPLPGILRSQIFEMPLPGYLGFPPFALECFVLTESARIVKERTSPAVWRLLLALGLLFGLLMCRMIDLRMVISFS